jgi:hypothetical protein
MRYARLLVSLLLIFLILAVGSQLLRRVLPTSGARNATTSEPAAVTPLPLAAGGQGAS